MSSNDLSIQNLCIGNLRGITLKIGAGEVHCLSGKSGSGKSRFLRAIADLEPHEGNVRLTNVAQCDIPGHQWRQKVRLIPTDSQWWFETAAEHMPVPPPNNLLLQLGLTPEILQKPINYLSSGEKQRLALIRALHPAPVVVLLDEPTANLDRQSQSQVESWLLNMIELQQWPTLWVAHDEDQISRVGHRHWQLENGKLHSLELARECHSSK